MILIIGANGTVGRLVTDNLIKTGNRPTVFVRDSAKARLNFADQADIVTGDLDQPETIQAAISPDTTAVFLCSPVNPEQTAQQNAVIDAAAENTNAHIVKLSGLATFAGSYVDSGKWHATTEHHLLESGLSFTCLHPYFFMQNLGFQLATIKSKGIIRTAIPDADIAMVDTGDIAEVVTTVLLNPELAPGETLPLTCRQTTSYRRIAELMSDRLGSNIRLETVTPDQLEQDLLAAGQPPWHVRILLQFNRAFSEGLGARVDPAAERLLGRAPVRVQDYLTTLSESPSLANPDKDPFPS